MEKNKKAGILIGYGILTAVLILFDQWTKQLAVRALYGKASFQLIPGVFELTYLENRGMAWGMLQGKRIFFLILTILVLAVLLYAFLKAPITKRFTILRIVLSVLFAGAVGNMIDRYMNGYVVDFFSFCLINFPIFNVADCYIVVGGIAFVLILLFYYKDEELRVFNPFPEKKA